MSNEKVVKIKELNTDIIPPSTRLMNNPDQGGSKIIVIGKPGCFAPGTKVLKYDGSVTNVEEVKVGDRLMGDDSTPRNVLELCNNIETMYKIAPDKGDAIVVNENHILSLKCTDECEGYAKGDVLDIVLKDFLEKPESFQRRFEWYKSRVEFEERFIDLDPYLLGYWLGYSNSLCSSNITVDEEVLMYFDEKLSDLERFLRNKQDDPVTYRVIQTDAIKDFKDNFLDFVRDNDLLQNKHIPIDYKCNLRQTRLELLAGIIDADGLYDREEKGFNIMQKSERLLDDIVFLARSLGLYARKSKCTKRCTNLEGYVGEYYRCFVRGNLSEVPCHIVRDGESVEEVEDVLVSRFNVERLEEGEYYGFVLDGNHRFLLEDFSVVHNTGKTTLIASLLYSKRHIFPVGMVMSGSEDSNGFYRKIMPSTFVYNEYNEDKVKDFIRRQKIAKQHLPNPWAVILLDDCTDDPRIFNNPLQHGMYKRGRHWKMWYILSLQYAMDVKPVIRTNVDGIFILREPILKNRKTLWENYASIIPDFNLFCQILDQITDDYTALYIHNANNSNDWQDCVFWYKAPIIPKDFRFGCPEYWAFHNDRYNTEYVDPFTC